MTPLNAKSMGVFYDLAFQEASGINPSVEFSDILRHREESIIAASLEKHLGIAWFCLIAR